MSILIGILTGIHVIVALALVALVLMQKSSEQGVGAAFGGGMTDTVFGGGTTTALVRMTIWCACFLLATTLILAVLHSHRRGAAGSSLLQKAVETTPAVPASGPVVPQLPGTAPAGTPATAPETAPAPTTPGPTAPAAPAPEEPTSP